MASLLLPGTPRSSELTWQGWRRRSSSAQEVPVSNLSAPFTYSIDRES
jgi:hypothetical protein